MLILHILDVFTYFTCFLAIILLYIFINKKDDSPDMKVPYRGYRSVLKVTKKRYMACHTSRYVLGYRKKKIFSVCGI